MEFSKSFGTQGFGGSLNWISIYRQTDLKPRAHGAELKRKVSLRWPNIIIHLILFISAYNNGNEQYSFRTEHFDYDNVLRENVKMLCIVFFFFAVVLFG